MIERQIFKTIEKNCLLDRNQHIVIGLSGGPDSVCLFYVLNKYSKEMGWVLHPVHINHKFRPGAAEVDQSYVEKLCEENGLKCESFVYDCNEIASSEKISSEEAGRKVRYEAFAQIAEDLKEKGILAEDIKIAVAHNADDQAETILFRIMRGTGIEGISGMPYRRSDKWGNEIIRPLLDCYKENIVKYCEDNNLNPCIDKTNNESIYTRNKIRLELIPSIEEQFNSNIKESLIRLGKAAAMDRDFISKSTIKVYEESLLEETQNYILFSGEVLRNTHPSLRQRIISTALIKLGLDEDVTFAHFDGAGEIIENEKPSARMDFPKGYYITKVYDNVKIARESDLKDDVLYKVEEMSLAEYKSKKLGKESHAAFDGDALENAFGQGFKERVALRTRLAGDYLGLDNSKSKKLQDYFVDRKIPKDMRDDVKLIAIGNEILWILPSCDKGRYSGRYKLCDTTKNVICIELFSTL